MQIGEILTSIQVPELIKDEFIRGGHFDFNKRGLPIHFSGGFTVVFPCIVKGEKWAFRCWFNGLGNTRSRFQKLSVAMRTHPLKYLCDFQYVDEGIVINGRIYPTTRMKWVEGMTIKDYVVANSHDKKALKNLAENFLQMCKELHGYNYSHGDLQHGNIIVNNSGSLFLIDYDSLYHTSMGNMPDIIAGLKDYQHPARKQNKIASEKVDYFSEAIIYTAILAVGENPRLVDDYKVKDAENMLFQASDYENFINSKIYKDLSALGGVFPALLEIIDRYLACKALDELLPLDVMLDAVLGEPEITSFYAQPNDGIYVGDEITIKWDANHILEQTLDGKALPVSTRSHQTVIERDTIYSLSVGNGIKRTNKKIVLKPFSIPSITFATDKKRLKKGKNEAFTLEWNVIDAVSVSVYDSMGNVIANKKNGQIIRYANNGTDFALEATGLDGKRVFKELISLEVHRISEVTFKIDKLFVLPGVPVTLTWDVKHAESVFLSEVGDVPPKGAHQIEPTADTVVTLEVKDKFGVTNYRQEIKMLPLPIVKVNPPTPAYNTMVTLVQPNIFAQLYVSLPQVPIGKMPTKVQKINISMPPGYVSPKFVIKRESLWHGIKDITIHLTKSFINKFNNIRNHE